MLTHKQHTHKVINVFLSIRANGTEHLHFLVRELKLSYLNVSPSIVAAHHFHSNPPQRNELELLFLSPFFSLLLLLSVCSTATMTHQSERRH